MNEKWITTEKKGNKIFVKIRLPKYDRHTSPRKIKLKTSDVRSFLKSKNLEVLKCIQGPANIRNANEHQREGTWIFELPKKPVQTRKKVKKVKKVLDKTPDHVIIEVQEKTLPPKEE